MLVGGRFRVRRKVATGGMGEVWEGEHRSTGMRVALKTLLSDAAKIPEVVLRFKREATLLGRIRSDRVARVIDFLMEPECGPVLVTEFVEGRPLDELMKGGPVTIEEALDLGIEIASALRELHRARIVHRDIKPGNVILQPLEDGRRRAVIVDLGVSRLLSSREEDQDELTDITRTHIVLGTISYMAPEQILSAREVTASVDIYALGAILFRMVTGRSVFGELSRVDLVRVKLQGSAPRVETGRTDRVARAFEAIVSRALQAGPNARYTSAEDLLADLLRLRGDVHRKRATGRAFAPRSGARRGAWRTPLAAAVAITLTACGAAEAIMRSRTPAASVIEAAPTHPIGDCSVVTRRN